MIECILNLGPFNDCIDDIGYGCTAEYGVSQNIITVPIVTLGLAINQDTPKNRAKLKRAVELKVLHMIYDIVFNTGTEIRLNRVKIPIKSVNFNNDDNGRIYIKAELGVAILKDDPDECAVCKLTKD